MSTTHPELLERSHELAELARALEASETAGSGGAVLVTGEAGAGKTALLRAFRDAHSPEVRFLWGASDPLFTPRPLGAIHDVAEQVGGHSRDLVASGAKHFELAKSLLRELSAEPTVLVLEDLHWADEASLDVLRLLLRGLEPVPALVVGSYRDDDLGPGHPFASVLGELIRLPRVGRLPLGRLSEAAVTTLAEPHGVGAHELYRATAGNPFFVTEVLASGHDRIPDTVRDAVFARVAQLSPRARRLLEAVAIGSTPSEVWLLEAIAADEVAALEECLAAGMLTAEGTDIRFRHELARLAVEASLPPHRPMSLHRAALAALAEPPRGQPDLARLAHHAEAAQETGAVQRFAPAAAESAAALGAHREAAAQYERALRHSDGLPLARRAQLIDRTAREYVRVGRFNDAVALGRRAASAYRAAGDRAREGHCLSAIAWPLWVLSRRDEAETASRDALALLAECGADHELGRAYALESLLRFTADDLDGTVAAGEKAIELAERTGDVGAAVRAATNIGAVKYLRGDARGREELERSLETARAAGLALEAAAALCYLAHGAARERHHALTARYIEAGLEVCNRHDLESWGPFLGALRFEQGFEKGHWDATAASATAVIDTGGAGLATLKALVTLGRLRSRRGEPGQWAVLDRALELARPSTELSRLVPVASARSEAAWLEGRDADALAETELAWDAARRVADPWLLGDLAQWRRRAGVDEEQPAGIAEPYALALAGDSGGAYAAWMELGCPYEAALAGAEGDGDLSRQALDQLHRLGARAAATLVARRLRERGARGLPRGPRPHTSENPAQLTAREVEIATLLADGLRNGEIAERLFISRRTVDHHVSAILHKLGVGSRGQVAAAAARLGLISR